MSNRQQIRIGTRGSDLAMTQASDIARSLQALGADTSIVVIRTAGDDSKAERFADIGPQGVFAREIELALLEDRVDIAVHSCKDLPTQSPSELCIGAVPTRVDAHDVMLIRKDALTLHTSRPFAPLKRGGRIGTSSERRRAWLKHVRPDLEVVPLRGNVPTRIGRLFDGDYDAILLAAAGLERLSSAEELLAPLLVDITVFPLDMQEFVPAPAQGALAVQCRSRDTDIRELLEQIDDEPSRTCVEIEREALASAEGGCEVAFGAHCRMVDHQVFELTCMLERHGQIHTHTITGAARGLGEKAWQTLEREFSGE
jgi:hydroxymethylbilane synthase